MRLVTYCFNEFSEIQECAFILDFSRCNPTLDLIPQPLQLLDFFLKVSLILFFLIAVSCIVNFLPNVFKCFNTFRHFLQTPVNFTWGKKGVTMNVFIFVLITGVMWHHTFKLQIIHLINKHYNGSETLIPGFNESTAHQCWETMSWGFIKLFD